MTNADHSQRLLAAHACEAGWEATACDELRRVFPRSAHRRVAAGWLESQLVTDDLAEISSAAATHCALAFTRQSLPHASAVEPTSVSGWAKAIAAAVEDRLDARDEPWRLDVFNVPTRGATGGRRRNQLIDAAVVEALARRRKLLRRRVKQGDPNAPLAVVQAGLVTPASGYLSVLTADEAQQWRGALSLLAGGEAAEIPRNLQAPSRAFAKLVEALERFGRDIAKGETCVDLGASPGGWTYVAIERGAQVTAIDRSPLAAPLMATRRVTFVRGDAFRWLPSAPVDWLLSDVVAFPPRVIELLDQWLKGGWCRRFVVTIKFRGDEDYPLLEDLKRLLAVHTAWFRVQRMATNKNEATAYGEAR